MSKIVAYIRVSTDKQTVKNQRDEISRYSATNKFIVDKWIEIEISSRKSEAKRRIIELIEMLDKGDTLITSELSRLGRSTQEVLKIIDTLIKKQINIIFIKQGLTVKHDKRDMNTKVMLTMFSLFAELERDLISSRTREALASRKGCGVLGHKKGTILRNQYDKDYAKIIELLNFGLSVNKIHSRHLKYGSVDTLRTWKNKRLEYNELLGEWVCNEKYKQFLNGKN